MSSLPDILQNPTNLPGPSKVPYTPLGGKVGVPDEAKTEMELANSQSTVNFVVGQNIGLDSYGNPGDGAILNHLRRRNLGYC